MGDDDSSPAGTPDGEGSSSGGTGDSSSGGADDSSGGLPASSSSGTGEGSLASSPDDSSSGDSSGGSPASSSSPSDDKCLADARQDADNNAGGGNVDGSNQNACSADDQQPPPPGTLIVTVKDDAGDLITDANVTISGPSSGTPSSQPDGTSKFANLTPGSYDTDGSRDGYLLLNASKNVSVPSGGTANGQITLLKIAVEIQVNNTPETNDDVVQLKCTFPTHRHKVPCEIRLAKATPSDVKVVLTNPDGKLRFPESGDTTKSLTLAANQAWSAFEISGEVASSAVGDASIEAHQSSAGGALVGSQPATVFSFDAKIGISSGGNYSNSGGMWTTTPTAIPGPPPTTTSGHAADFSAEATIKPAGIDCSVPQVKDLRIGIMQNAHAGVSIHLTWSNPSVAWTGPVQPISVPTSIQSTTTLPTDGNDSSPLVQPLYDQPGKPGQGGTLDPNSLNPPIGCANGKASTSFDTPSIPSPTPLVLPITGAGGVVIANVTWQPTAAQWTPSFTTWAVAFNVSNNQFCCLRQRGWHLQTDALAGGVQSANIDAADGAPSAVPVLAPIVNTMGNDPANTTTGKLGAATTNFP